MDRNHIRNWLTSLHKKGNTPATVSVRYRSVNRFLNWCVMEGERPDYPMDRIDPPKTPDTIQPYYEPHEVESVLKPIRRQTPHNFRYTANILTLYDAGVRAAELCGIREDNLDWRSRTIPVTGKANKQRRVSMDHKTAQAIERYSRKHGAKSEWLWLASGIKPLAINGLRTMLVHRFGDAGVKFRGAHAFRIGFAMDNLASGGQEGFILESHQASIGHHIPRLGQGEDPDRPVVRGGAHLGCAGPHRRAAAHQAARRGRWVSNGRERHW